MADYERVLLVKNEIFVYKIPPRQSNRGYRAADWDLQNPDWSGRMRLVSNDKTVFLKLEDKSGELFAQCPVESYPGVAVEAVNDSSRYFVIKIMDPTGRTAFIGIGFADRSDSFDLNVALQDHFKLVQKTEEIEQKEKSAEPALDLAFKEGQTISINIGGRKTGETKRPKPAVGGIGMLPPPPGSKIPTLAPPPSTGNPVRGSPSHGRRSPVVQPAVSSSTSTQQASSNMDSLLDLDMSSNIPVQPAVVSQAPVTTDPFGDLTSFASSTSQPTSATAQPTANNAWMGF